MTMNYLPENMMPNVAKTMLQSESAKECLLPMGETSERVADAFKVSRLEQDTFAMKSHEKAANAQKEDWFKDEIVNVNNANGKI